MILKIPDPHLYNITKGIPGIAQKWPEIQQILLTGNIYLMGEAPWEAPSRREVSLEADSGQERDSVKEEDHISEDGQEEQEEEDSFNTKETSNARLKTSKAIKGKNCEAKAKSRSTSIIDTMTGGSQSKAISTFDTLKRQKSPARGSSKSQSASQSKQTSNPGYMKRSSHTKRRLQL